MSVKNTHRQSGMTLIISLIILVTLTILGLTSMQATRTEVSMAGNLREADIGFNAAEAGLSNAESFVAATTSKNVFTDPSAGLYAKNDDDPDYYKDVTWIASKNATTTLPHVTDQPKYIAKFLGDRSQNEAAALNIGGYGSGLPGKTVSNFRITSKGVGQTSNSVRLVQSYYGKEY